jgi:hypothetical protein
VLQSKGHVRHVLFDLQFLMLWGKRAEKLKTLMKRKQSLNDEKRKHPHDKTIQAQLAEVRIKIINRVRKWTNDRTIATLEQAEKKFQKASYNQTHRPLLVGVPIFCIVTYGLHSCLSLCPTLLFVTWDCLLGYPDILLALLKKMRQWKFYSLTVVIIEFEEEPHVIPPRKSLKLIGNDCLILENKMPESLNKTRNAIPAEDPLMIRNKICRLLELWRLWIAVAGHIRRIHPTRQEKGCKEYLLLRV